jgi:hypothetical protein
VKPAVAKLKKEKNKKRTAAAEPSTMPTAESSDEDMSTTAGQQATQPSHAAKMKNIV